jgi:hypothetical protein
MSISIFVQNAPEDSLSNCRVLLATIRDKGSCPCPRCLAPKIDFQHVGLLSDMSQRISKARSYLRDKVAAAWAAIYGTGAPIKGSVPEAHLKEKSLVPTFVSRSVNICEYASHTI